MFKTKPSPMRATKNRRAGFTLIELLVSLAILAMLAPVIYQALQVSTLAGAVAQRKAIAARIAEEKLNEAIVTQQTQAVQRGTEQVGPFAFQWSLKDEPWTQLGSASDRREHPERRRSRRREPDHHPSGFRGCDLYRAEPQFLGPPKHAGQRINPTMTVAAGQFDLQNPSWVGTTRCAVRAASGGATQAELRFLGSFRPLMRGRGHRSAMSLPHSR